ncbi:MAG: sterol desaturase family protein [Planctomycetes bacterium]|nr:sterol desaturase family protein [Planctomycetota bacterium]
MKLEDRRAELLATIPGWYPGLGHFALLNAAALGVIGACAALLERPAWWHAALVLPFFAFANLFEWWVHRGPLHHPVRGLRRLYDRHTRAHHVAFVEGAMAIRHPRELKLVLFPPWLFPLFLLMNAPLLLLLAWLGGLDVGLVFLASAVGYYLVYEWLHTLHHWPRESWLGRRAVVAWLRRHHEAHHDPRRMIHGNWNVSFPLCDWLLGTTLPPAGAPSPAAAVEARP